MLQVVVVHIGSNNISSGEDVALSFEKYEHLLQLILSSNPTVQVCASGLPPRGPNCLSDHPPSPSQIQEWTQQTQELNRRLLGLAEQLPRTTYVPHPRFSLELLSDDGLHLSRPGVAVLAADIIKAVSSLPQLQRQSPTTCILPQPPRIKVTLFSDSIFKYLPRTVQGVVFERHVELGAQVQHVRDCKCYYIKCAIPIY